MRRFLMLIAAVVMTCCAYAQNEVIVGDMDNNGTLSVGDVTELTNTIIGKSPIKTIATGCNDNVSSPADVAGTWRTTDSDILRLESDGCAYSSSIANVSSFEFFSCRGILNLLDSNGFIMKAFTVLHQATDCLVLCPMGSSSYLYYYSANSTVESIAFVDEGVGLTVGATMQLQVVITPSVSVLPALTWTSSDERVATVNANGVITGVSEGTCTITVTSVIDATKTASINVFVEQFPSSITLSQTYLKLSSGSSKLLTATVLPSNASFKNVTWTSSNESVATVVNGLVTAVSNGSAVITATSEVDENIYATCTVNVGNEDKMEYVNLGLPSGTLWATCNIGAQSPEESGNYYAWGELGPQSNNAYSWTSYTLCEGTEKTMTKYCTNSVYGAVDGNSVLLSTDDAANCNWGENWKMPTYEQVKELINSDYTSITKTTQNGVSGYLVTGKVNGYTDKSVFFPATGYYDNGELKNEGNCYIWSSTLQTYYSYGAYGLKLGTSKSADYGNRYCGRTIRPIFVQEKNL